MTQLHDLSALEQAAAIRRGEVSPVELARHYLGRAERHNDDVGAYVTIAHDLALEQARAAERALRERDPDTLGPLHGVPVPIKDLTPVAGVPCTFGSAAFADFVPADDDRVATVLRAAGAPMLGKTHTPEFGLTAYTESEVGTTARTPHDLTRSASGSSGGAAAAVAAGLAPLAHGSDGGGSVRTPASVCGVVGFKPGRGIVSNGTFTDPAGLVTSGALARTVRDAAALLDVLATPEPGDPFPSPPPPRGYLASADEDPGRLRIARFCTPVLTDAPVHRDVLAGYEATSALLASLGHEVVDVEPPYRPADAAAFDAVWAVLGGLTPVPPDREHRLLPLTRWHRRQAVRVDGVAYARAITTLHAVARAALVRLAPFDAILSPTLAQPPMPVGALRDDADPARGFEAEKAFSPFASTFNVLGLPAVSLPLHWVEAGETRLPIGMTLAGRRGEDGRLVALAAELEAARPWSDRRPSSW